MTIPEGESDERIRPEVRALAARPEPVTLAEWKEFRGNSWEQELLIPRLDDEALAFHVEHCLKNCNYEGRVPSSSYDQLLIRLLAPELLRRLKRLGEEREEMRSLWLQETARARGAESRVNTLLNRLLAAEKLRLPEGALVRVVPPEAGEPETGRVFDGHGVLGDMVLVRIEGSDARWSTARLVRVYEGAEAFAPPAIQDRLFAAIDTGFKGEAREWAAVFEPHVLRMIEEATEGARVRTEHAWAKRVEDATETMRGGMEALDDLVRNEVRAILRRVDVGFGRTGIAPRERLSVFEIFQSLREAVDEIARALHDAEKRAADVRALVEHGQDEVLSLLRGIDATLGRTEETPRERLPCAEGFQHLREAVGRLRERAREAETFRRPPLDWSVVAWALGYRALHGPAGKQTADERGWPSLGAWLAIEDPTGLVHLLAARLRAHGVEEPEALRRFEADEDGARAALLHLLGLPLNAGRETVLGALDGSRCIDAATEEADVVVRARECRLEAAGSMPWGARAKRLRAEAETLEARGESDDVRIYPSDDRDVEPNDLVVTRGGNGDWYVTVAPSGGRIGPTVRLTTHGTPRGKDFVPGAMANLFRALGGEPPVNSIFGADYLTPDLVVRLDRAERALDVVTNTLSPVLGTTAEPEHLATMAARKLRGEARDPSEPVFEGRIAEPTQNRDGSRTLALWARAWADGRVLVSAGPREPECAPVADEWPDVFRAVVRELSARAVFAPSADGLSFLFRMTVETDDAEEAETAARQRLGAFLSDRAEINGHRVRWERVEIRCMDAATGEDVR